MTAFVLLAATLASGCVYHAAGGEAPPSTDNWMVSEQPYGSALPWRPRATDPAFSLGTGQVRWQPWRREIFADAARSHKMICLLITSNWRHAGAVMERGAFHDVEAATRLNEEFIPVRMDRDQHPDVDLRMQQAMQAMTGTRGWPLMVILAPDGGILWGSTSIAADDDLTLRQPGLKAIINGLLSAWKTDHQPLLDRARALEERLRKQAGEETQGSVAPDILHRTALKLRSLCDPLAGGFNGGANAPQFPCPRALELLLIDYARSGEPESLAAVRKTLDAMLRGGIYDQLGGGFHRCAADRWWRAPRFEKLLVLNAEMLPLCLHAWQATREPRYRQAVEETLEFWTKMSDEGGIWFWGSQAAGRDTWDEGAYFTWTVKNIESVLTNETDCRLAELYYGIEESGGLLQTTPARNVLFEVISLPDAAKRTGISPEDAGMRMKRVRETLLKARDARPPPAIDRTAYTDGNALMAAAFIECGKALDRQDVLERGTRTLKRLIKEAIGDQSVAEHQQSAFARHVLGKAAPPAEYFAQDEAALACASALAFDVTADESFAVAGEAALVRLEKFWDAKAGGYFDHIDANAVDPLPGYFSAPLKICQDTWEPSANGLAAQALARLAVSRGKEKYAQRAAEMLAAFGSVLPKLGPYGATLITAGIGKKSKP